MFVFLFGLAAPFIVPSLYLNSYMLPWLIWTAAALGLNLVTGWAGQLHLGYAAVMAVGAYSAIHAVRFGIPWEFALIIGGLSSSVIGSLFAFAALRVKGLYLALTTLAMQFVMDWVLTHSPAITGAPTHRCNLRHWHCSGRRSPLTRAITMSPSAGAYW